MSSGAVVVEAIVQVKVTNFLIVKWGAIVLTQANHPNLNLYKITAE
jgi:hypothetical protein